MPYQAREDTETHTFQKEIGMVQAFYHAEIKALAFTIFPVFDMVLMAELRVDAQGLCEVVGCSHWRDGQRQFCFEQAALQQLFHHLPYRAIASCHGCEIGLV